MNIFTLILDKLMLCGTDVKQSAFISVTTTDVASVLAQVAQSTFW